jgi:hypothetical protein
VHERDRRRYAAVRHGGRHDAREADVQSFVSPPYAAPVRVRLVRDDGGACWEATYSVPSRNLASGFKGKSD